MRHKEVPTWYPFYIDKWLLGSTRFEFTHEERSIWADLMTLAKKDGGYIRANEGSPYTPESLAGMFMGSETFEHTLDLVKRVTAKALDPRINKLKRMGDGTLFVLSTEKYSLSNRWIREFNKRKPIPKKGKSLPNKRKPFSSSSSSSSSSSLKIIFNKETNRLEGISEEFKKRLIETYPALNYEYQIKKIENHAFTNPTWRKSNWARTINNWFKREQDRGGSLRGKPSTPAPGAWHKEAEERIRKKKEEGELL